MNQNRQEHAYAILKTLHRSGHFIVYQGKHYISQELVVIKTIDPKWKDDPKLHQQIKDEAALNLRLNHRQIRHMRGIFEEDGKIYLVMDYIEGKALEDILGSGISLAPDSVKLWLDGILDALEHAHSQGIIHQNINPANLIITEDSQSMILGFGKPDKSWMKVQEEKGKIHPLMFVAPEVFLGGKPQPASDIYSLGALAYLMLCGRLPWTLDQALPASSQKQASLERPVLDPEFIGRNIPRWFYTVIHKCLRIDPGRRFASASQLRDALNAAIELPLEPIQIAGEQIIRVEAKPELPSTAQPEQKPQAPEPVKADLAPPQKAVVQPSTVSPPKPAPIVPPPKREPVIPEKTEPVPPPQADPIPPLKYDPVPPPKREPAPYRPVPPPKREPVPPPKREATFGTETQTASAAADPRIKKWGMLMGIASLLVILFAVVKYSFWENHPRLKSSKESDAAREEASMPKIQNLPIKMLHVQGDSTAIGSLAFDAADDEFPPIRVRIPNFWISPYEITNLQWSMVYPEHFYREQDKNLPVTNISFLEVLEYCNEKSLMDKLTPCYDFINGYVCNFEANGYRLPTEAEWEFAAKARKKDSFLRYSGSDDADRAGWNFGNSGGQLQEIGKKRANELGLYDMSGNAYEWVWNWYGAYSASNNAFEGPPRGTDRVIRGGSYYHDENAMRVTKRGHAKQFEKKPFIGFRVVRSDK